MPKGTKVMPAGQTAALMGITGVKKYKSGIGNFFGSTADKISDIASNIFSYIKDPKKLLKAAIDKFTDLTGALEPGITIAKTAVNLLFETAVSKIKGFFDSFGAVDYNYYKEDMWELKDAVMVRVDGETIKEDMWYTMVDGEVVEAEE